MGIVHGSAAMAVPLVIGNDVVYVHTDIEEIEYPEDEEMEHLSPVYQFHEIQYTKDEYIYLMKQTNDSLESEITDAQMALCELYEMIGG